MIAIWAGLAIWALFYVLFVAVRWHYAKHYELRMRWMLTPRLWREGLDYLECSKPKLYTWVTVVLTMGTVLVGAGLVEVLLSLP